MERRKAVTAAAAVSLTMLAGAAGITLNSNIVGAGANDDVGQLSPVSATSGDPGTLYVDGGATSIRPTLAPPPLQPSDADPMTASSASSYAGEDEHEEHEHEGRDDDD